ncbi:MAG: Adenylate/guanylate cyclase protein [Chloroflexi bacterium]|nr:Adenylate/guanylate cyclase protein [Chloroflexota bacterium]
MARRSTLVAASLTVTALAITWVLTYLALGRPLAAAIPFTYQVATVIGLIVISRGRGFRVFRLSQIALMTVLPFALQWSLGGWAASSVVSWWALVAALGAVLFVGAAGSVPWFLAFAGLTILSAVVDPWLAAGAVLLPDLVRTTFFGLNVLGPAATAFVIVQLFVRQREAAMAALDAEHLRSEGLLLNVLPRAIAERLKAGAGTIADAYPAVTVLFADVVDFTPFADRTAPADVVRILDRIFSAFDEIADRHGLEKIKTIGDAYLLVGGLPEPRADHAAAVALAALDLIDASERLAEETGLGLRIRIGMDTGPVVAGVIGRRKFSYDLWGDTVNTAARMESHGSAGRIHVTGRMEALLRDAFALEPRGPISLKGKGEIDAWFLVGARAG